MKMPRTKYLILLSAIALLTQSYAQRPDTIRATGNTVIFFAPSKTEYAAMPTDKKADINEVLSDFYHYAKQVTSVLEKNGISVHWVTGDSVRIETTWGEPDTWDRSSVAHESIVGILLLEPRRVPLAIDGVSTDVEILKAVQDYFQIIIK